MNPILARSDRLALYLGGWVITGGLLASALARPWGLAWGPTLVILVPLSVVYGFVCLSAWYVCRATPLRTSGALAVLVNIGGAAIVASGFWLLLGHAVVRLAGQFRVLANAAELYARDSLLLFTVGILLYLLAAAVHYVVIAVEESRAAETRALELQLLAREAELKTLRAQIDPHFLFNCLHSISALTGTDPAAARRMCLLLGEFLRTSVKLGAQDRIPFSDELALAERYLEIERVRFGPRLAVERVIEEGVSNCAVPALLLQPLVENAVTHGIAHLLDGGTVRLEARRASDGLQVTIENRCDPDRPKRPRTGVGLQNVRKRLAAQYGQAASVQVDESHDRFRVDLTLPWVESTGG
jgi:two-component system, LytTR family, sensor histidine kinase AlgZ